MATTSATAAAPSPAPTALGHRQVLVAFSGLVLVMLLAALDSTIVSTALPTIVGELGGLEHLAWVVTGYLLAQTVVTPVYGKLGDLYGRKIVLQSAIVLFLLGSALCGLSQNMTQLIAFRFIQGLGGGGLNVTTQAIVGKAVDTIVWSSAASSITSSRPAKTIVRRCGGAPAISSGAKRNSCQRC